MNNRAALFLRMAELLGGYVPTMFDEREQERLSMAWHEIAAQVEREVEMIREEAGG